MKFSVTHENDTEFAGDGLRGFLNIATSVSKTRQMANLEHMSFGRFQGPMPSVTITLIH